MNNNEKNTDETLQLDFTDQSQLHWREVEENYTSSRFFLDGTLHNKFVSHLSDDTEDLLVRIRDRYSEFIASQIVHLAQDWELSCWGDNTAKTVAKYLINQYDDTEFDAIRKEYLNKSNERRLWGKKRYAYVRKQFALELLEHVGAKQFRHLIDVRPLTQFNEYYQDQSRVFTVDELEEVAVQEILDSFVISDEMVNRAAIQFLPRVEPEWFANWTIRNLSDYSNIEELLSNRWNAAIKISTSLDITQFTAVITAAADNEVSRREVDNLIDEIHNETQDEEPSALELTNLISEFTNVSENRIDILKQIFSGAIHTDRTPRRTTPSSHASIEEYRMSQGATQPMLNAETSKQFEDRLLAISETDTPTRKEDADHSDPRLFIIPAAGKPTQIKRREVSVEKLKELSDVSGVDQLEGTYTAYAAPISQQKAVNGMATGDIVLFATEDNEYIGEYRIEHVLIAPSAVQEIWNETGMDEDEKMRMPYLLLLSQPNVRKFAQYRLNQLLGYRATTTPSLWGVSQDRIDLLTNQRYSLDQLIQQLDEE